MYEIWLAMNIVWEIALGIWPVLLFALAAWVVLVVMAARRANAPWRAGLPIALVAGIVVMVGAIVAIPSLTHSSLAELGYWVDWANLLAIAVGFGAVAVAFAWPLLALRGGASIAAGGERASTLPVHPGADVTARTG